MSNEDRRSHAVRAVCFQTPRQRSWLFVFRIAGEGRSEANACEASHTSLLLSAVLLTASWVKPGAAQTSTGSIAGNVLDPAGAVVP